MTEQEKQTMIVKIGDEVENADARFFVGAINESQQLCTLDKSKPWTLRNEASPMAACIRQGNYSASAATLNNLSNGNSVAPPKTDLFHEGVISINGVKYKLTAI